MGKVREWTGAKGARESAKEATQAQVESGQQAIELQREAMENLRADLAPYRTAGLPAMQALLGELGIGGPTLGGLSRPIRTKDLPRYGRPESYERGGFQVDRDPSRILDDPFFQQMAEEQEQRLLSQGAAAGLMGSGGSGEGLRRSLLSLGHGFRQQDIQNQMAEQAQRFNQLLNIGNIGQASAAQTGAAGLQSAGAMGGLLTDIGAARSAGEIARGNILSQSRQDLLSNFASGGMMGALTGGATNGLVGGLTSMATGGFFSDERLKEDIEVVGKDGELDIIEFKYKDVDGRYRGYRAHQVYEYDPESVKLNDNGYLMVDSKYAPERIA